MRCREFKYDFSTLLLATDLNHRWTETKAYGDSSLTKLQLHFPEFSSMYSSGFVLSTKEICERNMDSRRISGVFFGGASDVASDGIQSMHITMDMVAHLVGFNLVTALDQLHFRTMKTNVSFSCKFSVHQN
jgi:hypothetical protein